jgi:hypothetical protein
MTIYKIEFKRTKDSEWESGIKIELPQKDDDVMLDKTGTILNEVWEAKWQTYDFCIDLTPILKD